jgi:hypothetical protein
MSYVKQINILGKWLHFSRHSLNHMTDMFKFLSNVKKKFFSNYLQKVKHFQKKKKNHVILIITMRKNN